MSETINLGAVEDLIVCVFAAGASGNLTADLEVVVHQGLSALVLLGIPADVVADAAKRVADGMAKAPESE